MENNAKIFHSFRFKMNVCTFLYLSFWLETVKRPPSLFANHDKSDIILMRKRTDHSCSLFIQHHSKTHESIRMNAHCWASTIEGFEKGNEFCVFRQFWISYLWIESKVCKRVEYFLLQFMIHFTKRDLNISFQSNSGAFWWNNLFFSFPGMVAEYHQNILHIIQY